MKIKILYVVTTLQKTGPTNQLFYLLKYLDKKIFNPNVVTLSPETLSSDYKRFKELGIKIESLNLSRTMGLFLNNKRFNRLLKKNKPNIIQTFGLRADQLKIKYKIPKIVTIRTSIKHQQPLQIHPYILALPLATILHKYHLSYVKKCKFVVTCSKSLSEEHYKLYNIKNKYIQNSVDIEKYAPVSETVKKKIDP